MTALHVLTLLVTGVEAPTLAMKVLSVVRPLVTETHARADAGRVPIHTVLKLSIALLLPLAPLVLIRAAIGVLLPRLAMKAQFLAAFRATVPLATVQDVGRVPIPIALLLFKLVLVFLTAARAPITITVDGVRTPNNVSRQASLALSHVTQLATIGLLDLAI